MSDLLALIAIGAVMFIAGWSAKGAHDEYLYWEKGRKPWFLT